MDVYVLAGQSNMVGRGGILCDANGIKSFDGATSAPTDPMIQCFNSNGTWTTANDPLHDTTLDPGCVYNTRSTLYT